MGTHNSVRPVWLMFQQIALLLRFNIRTSKVIMNITHIVTGAFMKHNEGIIRKLAHQIWEAEGMPDGRANAHWERATVLVSEASSPDQAKLKRSIDPSEASGSTEPAQPDQT